MAHDKESNEDIHDITADPVSEGVEDTYGVIVLLVGATGERVSCLLPLANERFAIPTKEINGGLKAYALGLHDHRYNVGGAMTLGLLHVIGVQILRIHVRRHPQGIDARKYPYIGPINEVHRGVVPANENRIFVNVLGKVDVETILDEVKARSDGTGLTAECDVTSDV